MPITAKRWLSITQAATNMRLAKQHARDSVRLKSELIRKGQLTYEQAWNEYSIEIEAIAAISDSDLIIEREAWTYDRNYKHNEQERRRQERKRRAEGREIMQPRHHSYLERTPAQVAREIEETDINTDDPEFDTTQYTPEQQAEVDAAKAKWLAQYPETKTEEEI